MKKWTRTAAQAVLATYALVGAGAGIASADTHTDGDYSLLGGDQIDAPISIPINISGDAVAAGGFAAAASKGGAFVLNSGEFSGEWHTSGKYSAGGGDQIEAPIGAPINICGDAVPVAGIANAACKGSAIVINRAGNGKWNSQGKGSVLGGDQIKALVSAPIDICDNAVAVLGIAHAKCKGAAIVLNGHKHTGNLSMTGRLAHVLYAAPTQRTQPEPPAPGTTGTGTGTGTALPPLLQGITGITGATAPVAGAELPLLPGSGPVSVGSPLDSLTKPGATGATGGSAMGGTVGGLLGGPGR